MKLHSSESFILGTHALRETDRIVSFLTRDAGKKRGVARGARRAKSAFSGRARADDRGARRVLREGGAGARLDQRRRPDPAVLSLCRRSSTRRFCSRRWPRASRRSSPSRIRPSPSTASRRHVMDALFAGAPAPLVGGLLRRLDPQALGPLSLAARMRRLRTSPRGRRSAALRRAPSGLRRAPSAARAEALRRYGRGPPHPAPASSRRRSIPAARPAGLARNRAASPGSRAGTSWATSSRASACWRISWADGHWTGFRGRGAPCGGPFGSGTHAIRCSQCSPCSGSSRS